jgi:hypothetical protein
MRKFKKGTFVCCLWLDACSSDEWDDATSAADSLAPVPIVTVGILTEQTSEKIVIALNFDTINEKTSCIMMIPIKMIQKIKALT